MCKVLVTDGMNKNAIDNLRKFNIYSPIGAYFKVNISEQDTNNEVYFIVRG